MEVLKQFPVRASGRWVVKDLATDDGHFEQQCMLCSIWYPEKNATTSCDLCGGYLCDACFSGFIQRCDVCYNFACPLCGGCHDYSHDEASPWYEKPVCAPCRHILVGEFRAKRIRHAGAAQ